MANLAKVKVAIHPGFPNVVFCSKTLPRQILKIYPLLGHGKPVTSARQQI